MAFGCWKFEKCARDQPMAMHEPCWAVGTVTDSLFIFVLFLGRALDGCHIAQLFNQTVKIALLSFTKIHLGKCEAYI